MSGKIFFLLIINLLGCYGVITAQIDESCQIQINRNHTVDFNDYAQLSLDAFQTKFDYYLEWEVPTTDRILVHLFIPDSVEMGWVKEVKKVLQAHYDLLMINYASDNHSHQVLVRLPPLSKSPPDITRLRQRNILKVLINAKQEIYVNGQLTTLTQLSASVRRFLYSDPENEHLPVLRMNTLPEIGQVPCAVYSIIVLYHDYGTLNESYRSVYLQIREVYHQIWDSYAQQYFNKPYRDLSKERQEIIRQILPYVLSEVG